MVNKSSGAKVFEMLEPEDKDLIMFTITDLRLEKSSQQVHMVLSLKRKVQTEMLTTYLPTLLLLAITYATTFFKPAFFEASLTVNLTIMLVMTTIFTSKIEELPPTSDMKMIDLWLIFCLVVPFTAVILRTAIESVTCKCRICSAEPKEEDAKERKAKKKSGEKGKIANVSQGVSSGEVTSVWVGTGAKVAPQQVTECMN